MSISLLSHDMDGGKMTTPILPPYVPPFKPVPQVTPFTYRDGITMLKKLDGLGGYINKVLVPFVNENYSELADAFESEVNRLIDIIVNDSIEIQDPIVAQLIYDLESQTRQALDAVIAETITGASDTYPVYRLWTGSSYPARIPNTVNIFVGDADPGLLMDPIQDVWANDATTIPAVVAEVENTGSELYGAILEVSQTNIFKGAGEFEVNSSRTAGSRGYYPSAAPTASGMAVWLMQDTLSFNVAATFQVPRGWRSVKFNILWSHEVAVPSGDVYWTLAAQTIRPGDTIGSSTFGPSFTDPALAQLVVNTVAVPGEYVVGVTPTMLRVGVLRVSSNALDTFTGVIGLIGVEMVRAS
jgi:hypothetical protein